MYKLGPGGWAAPRRKKINHSLPVAIYNSVKRNPRLVIIRPKKQQITQPNWREGFARNITEAKYPQLWRGLMGAWAPVLGKTGSTLYDISGYNNHGRFVSTDSSTAWQIDNGQQTIGFTGSSQYITCGRQQWLENTNKFTMMFWFRRLTANALVYLSKTSNPGSTSNRICFELYSDGQLYFEPTGGTSYGYMASKDTNWHHAALVFDGTTATNATRCKIFLDGQQRTLSFVGTIGSATPSGATANFEIGRLFEASNFYTIGKFNNVRLYNRALMPQEILQDYRLGLTGWLMRNKQRYWYHLKPLSIKAGGKIFTIKW
jgi:hypothetical protein